SRRRHTSFSRDWSSDVCSSDLDEITAIAEAVHDTGGLLYYDGANANAILGISRPGDMGFDVVHFNLHKTLSTPHGGGGPGAGPVGGTTAQEPTFPGPRATFDGERFCSDYERPPAGGRNPSFYRKLRSVVWW